MLFRSDRKSTRLNSSHTIISYAVFCLKKKTVNRETKDITNGDSRRREQTRRRARSLLLCATNTTHLTCLPSLFIFFPFFFFFNDTATTEIYTLSLHDALPI